MGGHKNLRGTNLHIARANSGASSPIGSVTPLIVGEFYFDTTNLRLYMSTGTASNTAWIDVVENRINTLAFHEGVISFYNVAATGTLPATPAEGDSYIASSFGQGWGRNNIYIYSGNAWVEVVPTDGMVVFNQQTSRHFIFKKYFPPTDPTTTTGAEGEWEIFVEDDAKESTRSFYDPTVAYPSPGVFQIDQITCPADGVVVQADYILLYNKDGSESTAVWANLEVNSTIADHLGTQAGVFDWATTPQDFYINITNVGVAHIQLFNNTTDRATMAAYVNTLFTSAGIDTYVEAYDSGAFVGIRTKTFGSDQQFILSAGALDALAGGLSMTAGVYTGTQGAAPTGAMYVASDYQVRLNIDTGWTDAQVAAALISTCNGVVREMNFATGGGNLVNVTQQTVGALINAHEVHDAADVGAGTFAVATTTPGTGISRGDRYISMTDVERRANIATLTVAAAVADGTTITFGPEVYEFDTVPDGVTPGNIAVDVSGDNTATGVATALVTAMTNNCSFRSEINFLDNADGTITIYTTIDPDIDYEYYNALATTSTEPNVTFQAVTFGGAGVDRAGVNGWVRRTNNITTLTFAGNVLDGETVTFGSETYEFDTDALPGSITAGNIRVDVTLLAGGTGAVNAATQLAAAYLANTQYTDIYCADNLAGVLTFTSSPSLINESHLDGTTDYENYNGMATTETMSNVGNVWLDTLFGGSLVTQVGENGWIRDHIYEWNGKDWTHIYPTDGAHCYVESTGQYHYWDGVQWLPEDSQYDYQESIKGFFDPLQRAVHPDDNTYGEVLLTCPSLADASHADYVMVYDNATNYALWLNKGNRRAFTDGTTDFTAGYDWSASLEYFYIDFNGSGKTLIALTANCANQAAVIAHIQAELNTALGAGVVTVYDTGAGTTISIRDNVAFVSTNYIRLWAGPLGLNALATIGWSEGIYRGNADGVVPTGAAYVASANQVEADISGSVTAIQVAGVVAAALAPVMAPNTTVTDNLDGTVTLQRTAQGANTGYATPYNSDDSNYGSIRPHNYYLGAWGSAVAINDRYIANASRTYDWTKTYIYEWNGVAWAEIIPDTGTMVYDEASGFHYRYNGSVWIRDEFTEGNFVSVKAIYDPTTSTPSGPQLNERYISAATANGWTVNMVYEWNGADWNLHVPKQGIKVYVENLDRYFNYDDNNSWNYVIETRGFQDPVEMFYDPRVAIPTTDVLNERYIANETANGWVQWNVYQWNGISWSRISPFDGMRLFDKDTQRPYCYTSFDGETHWFHPEEIEIELADKTLYMDVVNGRDDSGDGTIARPFQTLIGFLRSVNYILASDLTIYMAQGTYNTESISTYLKMIRHTGEADGSGAGSLYFAPIPGQEWAVVETGNSMTANAYWSHTDAGRAWVVNEHRGRFLRDTGSGEIFPIRSNTATVLQTSSSNTYAPVAIGAYDIIEHAVVINCTEQYFIYARETQVKAFFDYIKLTGAPNENRMHSIYGLQFTNCTIEAGHFEVLHTNQSTTKCAIDVSGNTFGLIISNDLMWDAITLGNNSNSKIYIGKNIGGCNIEHTSAKSSGGAIYRESWYIAGGGTTDVWDNFLENFTSVIKTTANYSLNWVLSGNFDYSNVDYFAWSSENTNINYKTDWGLPVLNSGNLNQGLLTLDGATLHERFVDTDLGICCRVLDETTYKKTWTTNKCNHRIFLRVRNNGGVSGPGIVQTHAGRYAAEEIPIVTDVSDYGNRALGFTIVPVSNPGTFDLLTQGTIQTSLNTTGYSIGDPVFSNDSGQLTLLKTKIEVGEVMSVGANAYVFINILGISGSGIESLDTVAQCEAIGGVDRLLIYCLETRTFYEYISTSGATRDGEYVLNTSDGGTTRWVQVAGYYNENIVTDVTDMPHGFVNRSQSTITCVAGARIFTLTPTGGTYQVFIRGKRWSLGLLTHTIPFVTGMHHVYIDSTTRTLASTTTFNFDNIVKTNVYVGNVYVNTAIPATLPIVADERHGCVMPKETHRQMHMTEGAR